MIADALAGGDGGLDIDALLSGLPGHGGGGGLIAEALASQGAGGVSAWDMGAFGGFTAMNSAFTMEMTILHHDAVQAA